MSNPRAQTDQKFPPADVGGTLNPENNAEIEVDAISSEVAAEKEMKEEVAKPKKKEREEKEAMHTIKSSIIISGIIVAAIGAVFAITKKLREK